jgi:glycosyltransferase involved in cell wall biosynthesis
MRISAIVPARNEELNIAACARSLARQAQIVEIIVVNDQSNDGTAAVLEALRAEIPILRIIEARELPAGWVGKNHAAWLGAAEARGEWLLFTDADVTHLDGSAARALADAERAGATLVSYSPDQEMRTWGERALMPFVFVRLAARFSYEAVSDPRSAAAAANGQYLMIRREAYIAIGGHAAVRGEVLEDVALARRVKESGRKIYFARGAGIARTRMYRGFGEVWRGWTKNLYPLIGGMTGAAWETARVALWASLTLVGMARSDRALMVAGLLLFAAEHIAYAWQLRRNRYPLSGILYFMPAALVYAAVVWQSAATHRRGSVEWKGRVYPVPRPGAMES